nr:K343 [uncultured bacterium]
MVKPSSELLKQLSNNKKPFSTGHAIIIKTMFDFKQGRRDAKYLIRAVAIFFGCRHC